MLVTPTFLPIAETLIDSVFPTKIVFHRQNVLTFDPLSGLVSSGAAGAWVWPAPGTLDYLNAMMTFFVAAGLPYKNSDAVTPAGSYETNPTEAASIRAYTNDDIQPRPTAPPGGALTTDLDVNAGAY